METVRFDAYLVKVTEEIIAEKGSWLMIYPGDRIVVLSAEAGAAVRATMDPAQPPEPKPVQPPTPIAVQSTRRRIYHERRSVDVCVGDRQTTIPATHWQVLCKLIERRNVPMSAADLNGVGGLSVSARLNEMTVKGWVDRAKDPNGLCRYTITALGVSIVRGGPPEAGPFLGDLVITRDGAHIARH